MRKSAMQITTTATATTTTPGTWRWKRVAKMVRIRTSHLYGYRQVGSHSEAGDECKSLPSSDNTTTHDRAGTGSTQAQMSMGFDIHRSINQSVPIQGLSPYLGMEPSRQVEARYLG